MLSTYLFLYNIDVLFDVVGTILRPAQVIEWCLWLIHEWECIYNHNKSNSNCTDDSSPLRILFVSVHKWILVGEWLKISPSHTIVLAWTEKAVMCNAIQ